MMATAKKAVKAQEKELTEASAVASNLNLVNR